jgi:hypothetical protein
MAQKDAASLDGRGRSWYTVTDGNANFANSDGQQRPDFVPGQKASGKPCVPGTFFNTCAFQDPPLGSFGDVSLNSLQGPGNKNFDFVLEKIIPLRENLQLELRAEALQCPESSQFSLRRPGTTKLKQCHGFRNTALWLCDGCTATARNSVCRQASLLSVVAP